MKKINIPTILLLTISLLYCNKMFSQRRFCGEVHQNSIKEINTANFRISKSNTATIKIPVVVHILYNSPETNISDAQVFSQIDVLNRDFRKKNSDTINIPSIFKNIAADFNIEFALAIQDPQGKSTSGIIRKSTTKSYYSYTLDDAQSSADGGDDPWDVYSYLNIWVVPEIKYNSLLVLAYSNIPTSSSIAPKDGLVTCYKYFGTIGPVLKPYNKGRTATHEIGHWLGLYHNHEGGCVGMSLTNCSTDGDYVCDTPPQAASASGCPVFGANSCFEANDKPNMFMNFMDYTDDSCMNMFTEGQKNRGLYILNTYRASILNSKGLSPVVDITDDQLFATPTYILNSNSIELNVSNFEFKIYNLNGGLLKSGHQDGNTIALNDNFPSFIILQITTNQRNNFLKIKR